MKKGPLYGKEKAAFLKKMNAGKRKAAGGGTKGRKTTRRKKNPTETKVLDVPVRSTLEEIGGLGVGAFAGGALAKLITGKLLRKQRNMVKGIGLLATSAAVLGTAYHAQKKWKDIPINATAAGLVVPLWLEIFSVANIKTLQTKLQESGSVVGQVGQNGNGTIQGSMGRSLWTPQANRARHLLGGRQTVPGSMGGSIHPAGMRGSVRRGPIPGQPSVPTASLRGGYTRTL